MEDRRQEERRKHERRNAFNQSKLDIEKLKSDNAELQLIYNYLHKIRLDKLDKFNNSIDKP